MRKLLFVITAVLSVLTATVISVVGTSFPTPKNNVLISAQLSAVEPPQLSAAAAVLIDASSKEVLCEKNAKTRMGMASTTKIMTALVAAENCELDRVVSVSPLAIGVEGSSVYLYAGEKLTMKDLICAMLLESANDAAAAIAIEIGGSIEGFCVMMNEKAKELGLENTHFMNPHGLYHEEHYTTALELAYIASAALKIDAIKQIVATKKMTVTPIEGNTRVLYNHNKMLSLYSGAIGLKTGFTKKTGRCLVSAAEKDGLCLIAVTLNAPDDWNDHTRLLDSGFENFFKARLIKKGEVCHMLPVIGAKEQYAALVCAEDISITLPASLRDQRIERVIQTYNRYEFAPIYAGKVMGKVYFFADGTPVASADLLAATPILSATKDKKNNIFDKIKDIFT